MTEAPTIHAARTVLVGVTGGIAIYKAVELVRGLVKDGFQPLVVTTEAAQRFVMPLTFAAVSQAPVLDDQSAWQASGGWFQHIEAARAARVMVVAPATANTLAKMAAGMADNLLTAIYLAFRGPVIVAPTMNWAMNEHAATRENVRVLAERGVEVLPTEEGELACGEEGSGRMASPDAIRLAVRRALAASASGPLAGKSVVVTSGGTRERIDAVRFIGNRSSGKMGRAVADEAYLRGARVTLVTTQPAEGTPYDVVRVESAAEMAVAVGEQVREADVLVMAAAVADFRPKDEEDGKIERGERASLTLELVRTVDVLASTARPGLYRVGFAAEAGPRLDRARAKKAAKGVDLLVFNDILAEGVGIGSDENEITILTTDGELHVPRTTKTACAAAIADQIEAGLETMTPDRAPVLAEVEARVANQHLRRHMLATEAIMRALAVRLGEDADVWGLAGLGHDLDAEETEADITRHGAVAAETLKALGLPPEAVHAVAAHNPDTGVAATERIDIALIAADQLSGLITAAALVRPDKDLAGVKVKSVRKRYREGAFARGVHRESIARCGELGLELDDFLTLGLEAMQGIAAELGL